MQWLQSVVRLHSDITKFLSCTAPSDVTSLLPAAKPTASVMPQMQISNPVTMTTEPAEAAEIPAAMETETDEAETTLSVDTSEVNVSLETLSKESHDSSLSDAEHRSCSVVVDAAAACCESNGCNNVRRNDSTSPGNCCHSDNDATPWTESTRCSEYEAASVLSDMQQLMTIAAAANCPAPSTTFGAVGTGLNTASDTRINGVKTVDAAPASPLLQSSCSTDITGRAFSGQCKLSYLGRLL